MRKLPTHRFFIHWDICYIYTRLAPRFFWARESVDSESRKSQKLKFCKKNRGADGADDDNYVRNCRIGPLNNFDVTPEVLESAIKVIFCISHFY